MALPDFKITLRVNNQISITRQRVTRKGSPFFYGIENENHSHFSQQVLDRYLEREGRQDSYYSPATGKIRINVQAPCLGSKGVPPSLLLDITSRFQRGKSQTQDGLIRQKKGYGDRPRQKNFTAKSGQKIRECGAAIDILCDGQPNRCRVITLTLPSSGEDAFSAISDWSGYATNRLLQIVRRQKKSEFYWFYCVEHQKRGALHWHICLFNEDPNESERVGAEIVSKWRDILCDISTRSRVDLLYSRGFGRVVTSSEMQSLNQEMRKGCGAYFSKYAAKTSHSTESRKVEDINTINARKYPPSSFWGRSRNLARLCEEKSFTYRFEGMDDSESEELRELAMKVVYDYEVKIVHSFSFEKSINHCGDSLTVCEGLTEVIYVSPSDYAEILERFRVLLGRSPSSRIPERARRGGYLSKYEADVGYF